MITYERPHAKDTNTHNTRYFCINAWICMLVHCECDSVCVCVCVCICVCVHVCVWCVCVTDVKTAAPSAPIKVRMLVTIKAGLRPHTSPRYPMVSCPTGASA